MATSATHNGWHYDPGNTRLDFYYRGTRVGHINANGMTMATGMYHNVTTKAVDATLTAAEGGFILCSVDDKTMTLPTAVGNLGLWYIFKATPSVSTGITVDGDGSETIDGATNQKLMAQNETLGIFSDNSNWLIF